MTRRARGLGAGVLVALAGCSAAPQASPSPLPSGPGWSVRSVTHIGSRLGAPVVTGDLVWIAEMAAGSISGVSVSDGHIVRAVSIGNPQTLVDQGCGASSVHAIPIGTIDIRRCDLPSAMAAAGGTLWVTRNDTRQLLPLIAANGQRKPPIPVDAEPFGLDAGAAGIWMTDYQHDQLLRIDPAAGKVVATIAMPNGPTGVAVGSDDVWVACARAGALVRVDPATNKVTSQVEVGSSAVPVLIAFGSVWVRAEKAVKLTRVDEKSGAVVGSVALKPGEGRDGLDQLAADATGIWVGGMAIHHYSATTMTEDRTIGLDAVALAYDRGTLWAADILGSLVQIRVS